MRHLLILSLVLVLGNCTGMPVGSMLKLRGVDFSQTELSELAAGLQLPAVLQPRQDTTRLVVTVEPGDGSATEHQVRLLPTPVAADAADLARFDEPGVRLFAYRVDPDEIQALEAFRAAMLTKRAQAENQSHITLGVAADACRTSPLPEGRLPMTTYLRTVETGSFVVLFQNLDLRELAKDTELDARLPPCTS